MDNLLNTSAEVAGISTAVKLVVDVIKAYAPAGFPSFMLPWVALALGLLFSFLLIATQPETVWTLATVASATLRGVFGGIGAVVVTDVHKIARREQ